MHRHLFHGIIVGALFAVPIVGIAAWEAFAEGDAMATLATAIFGLAAGLCIGALIAANFAMLDLEETAHEPASQSVKAHVHA